MNVQSLNLEITGIGMVTSLGHDAKTACAAIRAGLSRPNPIHEYSTTGLADHESVPLLGHPVVPITNGFSSVGRWLQLCRHALHDLLAQLDARDHGRNPGRTLTFLCLPEVDGPRFEHDDRVQPERLRETFVAPLLTAVPNVGPAAATELRCRGRAGLAALLGEVELVLRSVAERVIVVAVDSYVDSHALMWLGQIRRLKHDDNPVGLIPGEAAVAVCLELGRRGHSEGPWARITRVGEAHQNPDLHETGRSLGRLLAHLLDEDSRDLYTDLNGESWRAQVQGVAWTGIPPRLAATTKIHHIAAEVGDTGEVSAWLNLAVAARSLQRGYARGPAVLVAASSEHGDVAGARLERG